MARPRSAPELVRLVLDEDIGSVALRDALQPVAEANDAVVELLTQHFRTGTPDAEWLPLAGERGWAVVTHDVRQRRRAVEKQILISAGVFEFVLRGNLNGDQIRDALVKALPAICRKMRTFAPPVICHITRDGGSHRYRRPATRRAEEGLTRRSRALPARA